MTAMYLVLAGIGLLLVKIAWHTGGAARGMGQPKKILAALAQGAPQPFEGIRRLPPRTQSQVLSEVLRVLLLDDEFDRVAVVTRYLRGVDAEAAELADLSVAELREDAPGMVQAARSLLATHPKNVGYRVALARGLLATDAAGEAYDVLQAGDPGDPTLARVLVEVLVARGEHERAAQLLADTEAAEQRIERQLQGLV